MASQYLIKKKPHRIKAAHLLARAFNTLDVRHLEAALLPNATIDGDKESFQASNASEVLEIIDKHINYIGALHHPSVAEVARLEYAPRQYYIGVSIEIDEVLFMFLSVHTDKNGMIKEIYFHADNPSPCDAELSGNRPGFYLGLFESHKECLWDLRRAAVKRLAKEHRPHFVAIILPSQDPERILLVLDELTRNFDGSSCELMVFNDYAIGNTDEQSQLVEFQPAVNQALEDFGYTGFPILGVKLGDEVIRPGYRSWSPDDVTSDLMKMGLSKRSEYVEQVISVN